LSLFFISPPLFSGRSEGVSFREKTSKRKILLQNIVSSASGRMRNPDLKIRECRKRRGPILSLLFYREKVLFEVASLIRDLIQNPFAATHPREEMRLSDLFSNLMCASYQSAYEYASLSGKPFPKDVKYRFSSSETLLKICFLCFDKIYRLFCYLQWTIKQFLV